MNDDSSSVSLTAETLKEAIDNMRKLQESGVQVFIPWERLVVRWRPSGK